jgi:hypothetical protein
VWCCAQAAFFPPSLSAAGAHSLCPQAGHSSPPSKRHEAFRAQACMWLGCCRLVVVYECGAWRGVDAGRAKGYAWEGGPKYIVVMSVARSISVPQSSTPSGCVWPHSQPSVSPVACPLRVRCLVLLKACGAQALCAWVPGTHVTVGAPVESNCSLRVGGKSVVLLLIVAWRFHWPCACPWKHHQDRKRCVVVVYASLTRSERVQSVV